MLWRRPGAMPEVGPDRPASTPSPEQGVPMPTSEFPSLSHVAVTVPDFHHTVYLLGTTPFGLHQHKTPAGEGEFSEFRVGLDHVAFGVANRAELEKWARRLDELGIAHGEIKDAGYGSGLSFRDPDGIALEFFAPPS